MWLVYCTSWDDIHKMSLELKTGHRDIGNETNGKQTKLSQILLLIEILALYNGIQFTMNPFNLALDNGQHFWLTFSLYLILKIQWPLNTIISIINAMNTGTIKILQNTPKLFKSGHGLQRYSFITFQLLAILYLSGNDGERSWKLKPIIFFLFHPWWCNIYP